MQIIYIYIHITRHLPKKRFLGQKRFVIIFYHLMFGELQYALTTAITVLLTVNLHEEKLRFLNQLIRQLTLT